jgi:plasmid maintenance system killer protein
MCGGGGGPSGETKYNWNDTLNPKWQQLLGDAQGVAYNNGYQQYGGQRIAGMNQDQTDAMGSIRNTVVAGGAPAAVAANNQAEGTLRGDYLTGPGSNFYGQLQNQYSGYGPKFQQQLQGQLGDITNAYNQGTAADTTRMFNMAGAFGGSAHQNAMANNEAALGKTLSNATANAYQNQFNQSAGLQENQINRGNANFENERARQLQAISGGQNTNNMAFQGAQQLMATGDAQRGIQQDQLNQQYQDWLDKNNQDFKNADWLSGIYSRAQGGMSANSTSQSAGYQANPFSQLLGGYLGYKAMT